MSEFLELAHLVDKHRVSDVQIRRGRVEAGLDDQRAAFFQLLAKSAIRQDLLRAAAELAQLNVQIRHRFFVPVRKAEHFITLALRRKPRISYRSNGKSDTWPLRWPASARPPEQPANVPDETCKRRRRHQKQAAFANLRRFRARKLNSMRCLDFFDR